MGTAISSERTDPACADTGSREGNSIDVSLAADVQAYRHFASTAPSASAIPCWTMILVLSMVSHLTSARFCDSHRCFLKTSRESNATLGPRRGVVRSDRGGGRCESGFERMTVSLK